MSTTPEAAQPTEPLRSVSLPQPIFSGSRRAPHLEEILLVGQCVDHVDLALLLAQFGYPEAAVLPPRCAEVVGPVRTRLRRRHVQHGTQRRVSQLHQSIVGGPLPQLKARTTTERELQHIGIVLASAY